jgi:hypothetical protein
MMIGTTETMRVLNGLRSADVWMKRTCRESERD